MFDVSSLHMLGESLRGELRTIVTHDSSRESSFRKDTVHLMQQPRCCSILTHDKCPNIL